MHPKDMTRLLVLGFWSIIKCSISNVLMKT